MKKASVAAFLLIILAGCTKSETQYPDHKSSRGSVNNQESDTIRTLQQESDTLQNGGGKRTEVTTDNE